MSNHPFQNRQPTKLEDQAYSQARQHFAEHLKQFPTSQDAVKQLERDLAKTAIAVNLAVAQAKPDAIPIPTDDGAQWHKGVDLFDNLCVCYRPGIYASEYAVVERFPNGKNEIWNRGHNAVEVLRAFANDQKQALQAWSDDLKAQVTEFLAEKYPGQDMSRVADAFVLKCTTETVSRTQAVTHNHGQKRGGGIHI
jgi:hypothetical protein